eukprot:scaffold65992_cov75-Phaeocystis_antarctica.AAC.4
MPRTPAPRETQHLHALNRAACGSYVSSKVPCIHPSSPRLEARPAAAGRRACRRCPWIGAHVAILVVRHGDALRVAVEGHLDAGGAQPLKEGGAIAVDELEQPHRRQVDLALDATACQLRRERDLAAERASPGSPARRGGVEERQPLALEASRHVGGQSGAEVSVPRPRPEEQPRRKGAAQRVAVADVASMQVELGEDVTVVRTKAHRVHIVAATVVCAYSIGTALA